MEPITLDETRHYLRENRDEGVDCPACTQFVKVYRRKVSGATARTLIAMHLHGGDPHGWINLTELLHRYQADEAKARYWGLIEQQVGERGDGSPRTGWWRLTDAGELFVLGHTVIQKYALIFNGNCLGFDGPNVHITDTLGTRFNYADLMAGR